MPLKLSLEVCRPKHENFNLKKHSQQPGPAGASAVGSY